MFSFLWKDAAVADGRFPASARKRRRLAAEKAYPVVPALCRSAARTAALLAFVSAGAGLAASASFFCECWAHAVGPEASAGYRVEDLACVPLWGPVDVLAVVSAAALVCSLCVGVAQSGAALAPPRRRSVPGDGGLHRLVQAAGALSSLCGLLALWWILQQAGGARLPWWMWTDYTVYGVCCVFSFQLAVAFLEYVFRRRSFERAVGMTREELLRERLEEEGRPEVRERILGALRGAGKGGDER